MARIWAATVQLGAEALDNGLPWLSLPLINAAQTSSFGAVVRAPTELPSGSASSETCAPTRNRCTRPASTRTVSAPLKAAASIGASNCGRTTLEMGSPVS
jgi:hypothetical protein